MMKSQPDKINISPRQLQVLCAISEHTTSKRCSATIADVAATLNIGRSTVFEHIAALREQGLLRASTGKARCLKLTALASSLLEQKTQPPQDTIEYIDDHIPLIGKVAAGLPIEAIQSDNMLSLKMQFGGSDDIFALQVAGNSMIEEGIRNGDYVICKKSATANNGQLAVIIVGDDSATLKRFYKEKNCARLQPANKDYLPIYTDNCRIEAIVLGLIRKF